MAVSIVPLWNWNVTTGYAVAVADSFNRTFMELKSQQYIRSRGTLSSFNRTFMELKF